MLWLPEMQRGREAESAQAGRGNLRTQTLIISWSNNKRRTFSACGERRSRELGSQDFLTCAVKEEAEEGE